MSALVGGLMSDHTSHTFASAAEWAYVPSPAEVAFYDELDVKLAMNRGKNQPVPAPVKRPWHAKPVVAKPRDPEHDARLARLQQRLGIS